MDKKCSECGESILGRSDKKFCSDACRNAFNNRENRVGTNLVRRVNATLSKNRKILLANIKGETGKAHKKTLSDQGFNFNYHTHSVTTKKGSTYFFCYDAGYLPLEKDYFLIVSRNDSSQDHGA
ncbi:MAG TPA: DUF2116 family Zn-ribbon domain-containing protein [Bacteroidia bacterium]|nr:DUF2116 family Zn-ribbon domain-containing protein [Bacteroidia bacterium]